MSDVCPPVRIAIVGPESCGKSTLAAQLAKRLQQHGVAAVAVAEYARAYYANRPYQPSAADILAIARGQLAAEQAACDAGASVLLCDTTVLTCRIWAEVAFGQAEPALLALNQPHAYTQTLLTAPDLPWQPDPLRSHPDSRDWLLGLYRTALQVAGVPYQLVAGQGAQREAAAWAALRRVLPQLPVF
ncbi:ATP-binding protein [Vogesella sp. DC21W]|uniref:ATP-binding protein n=1 Tax=Vogesella aquatica TaxID=2984206 RepID=A0ABT5IY16_9NEIS|nr:ATP-binding protein [Vogesella aquatica]MDC7717445.1 ATP-binding protein [Vogesella aquatica]